MAAKNFVAYESDDDNAALNDRYDALPDQVESSETEIEEPEDDEEDEVEEEDSDEEEEKKPIKLNDRKRDPFEGWQKIAGTERKIPDFSSFLLDDADLKNIWENQEQVETDDDDYDESESEDDEHDEIFGENQASESDEDESEIEEVEDDDSPPPTPVNFDVELGVAIKSSGDEDDDDDDGADDVSEEEATDVSADDITADSDEDEAGSGENEAVEQGEGKSETKGEEEEKENKGPVEAGEEGERKKKFRKVPKDSDDSDSTEWETVTEEESEPELIKPEPEPEVVEEEVEEVEEKPKTPDPYGYTELHTTIECIEEYDGDFLKKFSTKYKSSANSSSDESDYHQGGCDVDEFPLEKQYSVVKAHKTDGYSTKDQQRRRVGIASKGAAVEAGNENNRNGPKNGNNTNDKKKYRKSGDLYVDLNIYNFEMPKYNSAEEIINDFKQPKNVENKKSKLEEQTTRKKGKTKKLNRRKKLEKLYQSCHPWYKNILKIADVDEPSRQVPSYRVKARQQDIKDRTVKLAMDKVLTQTFSAIDEMEKVKLRKEATFNCQYLMLQLADEVVGEVEEYQQRNAVRYAIDILLDKWEESVYDTTKTLVEQQLDKISESLVTNTITKVRDEIQYEDRVATLAVRDSLAAALDDLGKNRVRITRSLFHLFGEYEFEEYDFDKGETKVRQKVYKRRKELDRFLKQRAGRVKESTNADENKPRKRTRKTSKQRNMENRKSKNLNKIAEEDQKEQFIGDRVKEEEVNFHGDHELVHLSSDCLSEGEESFKIHHPKSVHILETMHKVSYRQKRRADVLAVWHGTEKQILTDLREENEKWNALFDTKEKKRLESIEKKRKTEQRGGKPDANYALYSSEEEIDENDDGNEEEEEELLLNEDKRMPNLRDCVEKAIDNSESKITVVPVKAKFKYARSEDSAVGSGADDDKKDGSGDSRKRNKAKQPLDRRDTGISSIADNEDANLTAQDLEQVNSISEFIKLIPTIDRDQFLNQWLVSGGPRPPAPPEKPPERARVFRFRRPRTAESVASVRDVVPLENKAYRNITIGRLNSAKSTRSSGRPESAHSIYTERSSLHSRLENRDLSSDLESDEDEKSASTHREKQNLPTKNTKIEYLHDVEEETTSPSLNEKYEKEMETASWNFYSRQQRVWRSLQETLEADGRPQLIDDFAFAERDFKADDFDRVLRHHGVEINGMYDDEDVDIELLRIANQTDSNSDSGGETNDKEGKGDGNCPSISPPSTPWKRQKKRPITPDSMDSDEELQKIKKKHYDLHTQKQQGERKTGRLYKEYLKKKDVSLPPPPKLGWTPTQGLIKWKDAREELKKTQKVTKKGDVNMALNRTLFNQLQLSVKRIEKHNTRRGEDRLLNRRATLHTEQLTLTNLEKRKKLLPKDTDPRSVSPRSSRSVPSYARTTKASKLRGKPEKKEDKLPPISKTSTKSTSSKKKATTARK